MAGWPITTVQGYSHTRRWGNDLNHGVYLERITDIETLGFLGKPRSGFGFGDLAHDDAIVSILFWVVCQGILRLDIIDVWPQTPPRGHPPAAQYSQHSTGRRYIG